MPPAGLEPAHPVPETWIRCSTRTELKLLVREILRRSSLMQTGCAWPGSLPMEGGLLTQVAEYQGMIAVEGILGGQPRPADYTALPRVTFTDPEVGSVGLTESAARDAGHDALVTVTDLRSTFRAWLHATGNSGLIKLVADANRDRLLGATVVGPRASEVLAFLTLAVREGNPLANLVYMIYGFPTFHGGVGEALGAYGRGIVKVLDPPTQPMFDDPPDRGHP